MTDDQSMVADILPLSPLQQGLLFHALFDEDARDVYTMQFRVWLDGPVEAGRLRGAADALLARHANLRAAFLTEDVDEPVQVVLREVTLPWAELDLSGLDESAQLAELDRLAGADRATRFDLTEPPLLRLSLVSMSPDSHVLVMSNHHLLLDGWSIPLLMHELLELYGAKGDPAALPEVRPYRDFLVWLSKQDRGTATEAWRQELSGLDGPTLLAPRRAAGPPVTPEVHTVCLPAGLTERLRAMAAAERLTVNTVVQGLWGLLLGRLTGREDVVFGATVSGRPAELPGVESMIGLFINTIPVRMRPRPGEPVGTALRRLQDEQSSLIDYHYLGLSRIQRCAGGDGGSGDLFDTLVVFENYPLDADAVTREAGGTGVRVSGWHADGGTHYPLTLAVFDESRLTVAFEFRADIFDRDSVEMIAARWQRLLRQVVDDPRRPVAALDMLDTSERAWLLGRGTATAPEGPVRTLHAAVERHAARTPDARAVVADDGNLTFAELNARANRLARLLVARGAGPERIVAVALPPGAQAIVVLLAVLKAGATYLPLDPAWPAERIGMVLADARPVLLITVHGVAEPGVGDVPALAIDDSGTGAEIAGYPATDLTDTDRIRALHTEHPAYVIYTSGSTGEPKAVLVPHRAIGNLLAAHRSALFDPARASAGRPLRVGHAWPSAFDASWQPTLWMFAGHELHVVPAETRRDPAALRAFLAEHGIEFIELSPSLLGEVLAGEWRGDLRVLGVGGEAVPPELWRALRAEDGLTVYNLYGPTECTVDAAACDLASSEHPAIGLPVPGARLYILDRQFNPVPAGVSGELYVAGAGLARGYLGKPGLTASRFVADPLGPPGSLMYRTGDVARWRQDGLVECLGRVDDEVKIRGYRVDPGEVEAALLRHPDVERAAVIAREDTPGTRRLVAYVIPAGEGLAQPGMLREYLTGTLPDHLVPAAVVQMERFPRTGNDKLDVAALPAPERYGEETEPPRDAAEQEIAAWFAEVLGMESVGVHDSFFALGGDSILSMRLVSKARAAGTNVSPRDVFEHPTVAELARATGVGGPDTPRHGPAHERTEEQTDDGSGTVPLTPMLAWLTEQVSQGGSFRGNCQARLVDIPSDVDSPGVERVVQCLLDRHDVLRGTLAPHGTASQESGEWTFHIAPAGSVAAADRLREVDATRCAVPGAVTTLDTLAEQAFEVAAFELDPRNGVMARFVRLRTGEQDNDRLLLVVHHTVVDDTSWAVLLTDLRQAWQQVGHGEQIELGTRGTSFRRWALGLRAESSDPRRVAERHGWERILSAPDPVLGAGPADPVLDTVATVRSMRTELPDVGTISGLGERDVLLTALAIAVASWRHTRGWAEHQTSVLVSLQGHGRTEGVLPDLDISTTVGWFSTAFPVLLDPGAGTAAQRLHRVSGQVNAITDGGIGYGLLRYLNPETAPRLRALGQPQIQFNHLGRVSRTDSAGTYGALDNELPAPHSLLVETVRRQDGATGSGGQGSPVLETTWRWPVRIFTPADIRELSEHWAAGVDSLRTGVDQPGTGADLPRTSADLLRKGDRG